MTLDTCSNVLDFDNSSNLPSNSAMSLFKDESDDDSFKSEMNLPTRLFDASFPLPGFLPDAYDDDDDKLHDYLYIEASRL